MKDLAAKRMAVYTRYSSDHQSERSCADQIARLVAEAERRGGRVSPDLVFEDRAVSGSSADCPEYLRLLLAIDEKRVDVIMIEDLSRLGRAQADLHLMRRNLEHADIRLISIDDGIDTIDPDTASMTFGFKGMISEMYLRDLSKKTRRGLLTRARDGFATGGVPLGYCTERVADTKGGTSSTIVIDDETAALVIRILELYRDGRSHRGIAELLNREGVPSPRAKTRSRYRGWVASTVRAILHNETYLGKWTYNQRRWRKAPNSNKRRPVRRDPSEVIRLDRPELRIVPKDLWAAVHERLDAVHEKFTRTEDGKPKGKALGRGTNYLFSGLLHCGACGAPMMIAGGSPVRVYRCSGRMKRGTCANALSIREDVVRGSILREMRGLLTSAKAIQYARKAIVERLAAVGRESGARRRDLQRRVTEWEEQAARLVDFIASGRSSATIAERLAETEGELEAARADLRHDDASASKVVELPAVETILDLALDVVKRFEDDVPRAREALRHFFRNGRIDLVPQPGGFYIARSEALPLVSLLVPPETAKPPSGKSGDGHAFLPLRCAGGI